ncbi:hypothetical protein HDE_13898 [Halotydeus destructor]|nr:hypothetical protein HDE_13898 [Halotydeus destructor]
MDKITMAAILVTLLVTVNSFPYQSFDCDENDYRCHFFKRSTSKAFTEADNLYDLMKFLKYRDANTAKLGSFNPPIIGKRNGNE